MARELVSDGLWAVVEPLLPPHLAKPGKRGRPPIPDRAALTGIVFVLKSGPYGLPQRDGVRLRDDMLASLTGLAQGGCPIRGVGLETAARDPVSQAGTSGADRLEPRQRGLGHS